MSQVLTTSSAAVTTTSSFYIIPMSGSAFSFDNFQFVSDSESTTTAYTYDAANELLTMASGGSSTAFTYDDWGRTVSKTMSGHTAVTGWRGGTLRSYTTDFPDETSVTYNYDGFDKRRNKLVGSDLRWYRWNTGYNVIAEYGGTNGSWTFGTQTMTYIPGLAEIAGADAATGTYRYYSTDRLGSIRRIRDNSMASLATYEYEPYGDEFAVSGLALNKGFTGHTYEPETGMYFAPYRYYDIDAARWASRDPLGMVDGPNVYSYVRDNPIHRNDRLGLQFVPTWPPPSGYPSYPSDNEDCLSHALNIADNAVGATESIRHCVATCELKRCFGTVGGWAATWANYLMDLAPPFRSDDYLEDFDAGNDGALIPPPSCDKNNDNYCTDKCHALGW